MTEVKLMWLLAQGYREELDKYFRMDLVGEVDSF